MYKIPAPKHPSCCYGFNTFNFSLLPNIQLVLKVPRFEIVQAVKDKSTKSMHEVDFNF